MPDKYSSVTVDEVKQIFTHLVPDGDARYSLLRLLLSSTDLANSIAPLAWGVTQYSNGFRLNVGQVEAVVFLDASLHVNLIGEVGMPPFAGDTFRVVQYATVPYTTCRFHGSIETFEKLRSELQSSHFEFIRRAAATGAGFPRRGTPFRRFHCHSLIDYAKQETDQFDGGLDQRVSSMEADKLLDANSPRAREGYDIDRVILAHGRNAKLADERKRLDRYTCQACGFRLQVSGSFVIEVHHLSPLAVSGETETSIEQLVSLCPTCHRVAHLRSRPFSVEELRALLWQGSVGKNQ